MYGKASIILTAPLLAACIALPTAALAQTQSSGITVTGSAEVKAKPDVAYVTFGVQTEAATAAAAAQENARLTNAVIDAIVRSGIARAEIETAQYSVSPIIDYQKSPPTTTGYRVSNQIRVRVKDLTKVGPLIDTAIAAGANNVQGVTFDILDPSAIRREALVQAMQQAQADARLIADTLNVKLGKVISVTESGPVIPRPVELGVMRAEAAPTPIIPGQVTVSASVTVVYSIL